MHKTFGEVRPVLSSYVSGQTDRERERQTVILITIRREIIGIPEKCRVLVKDYSLLQNAVV